MGGKPRYQPRQRQPQLPAELTGNASEAMEKYVDLESRIQDLEHQLQELNAEREQLRFQLLDWLGSESGRTTPPRRPAPAKNGRRRGRARGGSTKDQVKAVIPDLMSGEGQSRADLMEGLQEKGLQVSPAHLSMILRELRDERVLRVVGQRRAARYYPLKR